MKKEKKEKQNYLNKEAFLLGRRRDNEKIYLEGGSWDCNWYWGFGYLEIYNKPKTDIKEHYHFNSLLEHFGLEGIENHFKSFVLDEKEMWILADLMSSFYKLQKVAGFYHRGNSNYTDGGIKRKDKVMYNRINKDIEGIIKEVEKLLTPNEK